MMPEMQDYHGAKMAASMSRVLQGTAGGSLEEENFHPLPPSKESNPTMRPLDFVATLQLP